MKKQKCRCRYGDYELPRIKQPDKDLFRLRIKALLLSYDFKAFCLHPDVADMERDALNAWADFPAWAEIHKGDYCLIALLFYGNIFQNNFGYTWTRFKTSTENILAPYRLFPFHELPPGAPAPQNSITISFDPSLRHSDLKKFFQALLSKVKKGDPLPHTLPHPLSGYYDLQPKAKWDEVARFIEAATRAKGLKEKRPNAWLPLMMKLYEGYPGAEESKRKIIYSDIKKGRNVSDWALRGIFPKSSRLT